MSHGIMHCFYASNARSSIFGDSVGSWTKHEDTIFAELSILVRKDAQSLHCPEKDKEHIAAFWMELSLLV